MYAPQPKKMITVNILEILRRYSDYDHHLSQGDIVDILQRDYAMTVERKAVKRNLMELAAADFNINYSERTRKKPNGEEETVCSDWYMEGDITDAELRLIIDSLLFSKSIPTYQREQLIDKISQLSSNFFDPRAKNISGVTEDRPENREMFLNVEVLDEAITKKRKVIFCYCDFGTDKKLHPRLDEQGNPRHYLVNPYQMVATNGRYYLVGNYNKYNNLSHYRVDRMSDVQLLADEPVKPLIEIEDARGSLDLPKHMAEHIYMYSGPSVSVTFCARSYMINDIIDWFGNGVRFLSESNGEVVARVRVNEAAMRYWALQYGPHVRIVEPARLAQTVRKDLADALHSYDSNEWPHD